MIQSDVLRDQARSKHLNGETVEAIRLLTQAIQQDPSNTMVAMDMVQIFINIGELEQATDLFNKLPDSYKGGDIGKTLLGQLTFHNLAANTEGKTALAIRLGNDEHDYAAHFDLAICLVSEHDYQQAVEHLFEILIGQPEFKDGAAREMIITVTDMLSPNEPELAQSFRRRLANSLA